MGHGPKFKIQIHKALGKKSWEVNLYDPELSKEVLDLTTKTWFTTNKTSWVVVY
jgi:hypothetical protein